MQIKRTCLLLVSEDGGKNVGYMDLPAWEDGKVVLPEARTLILEKARNIRAYTAAEPDHEGWGGLATVGPDAAAQVGAELPQLLVHRVQYVIPVTQAAEARFQRQGWGRPRRNDAQ